MKQLLILFCLILTGCVSYGDLHSKSKPLDPQTLDARHIYRTSNNAMTTGWWNRLHDPQLNQLISVALNDSPTLQIAESRVREARQITMESAASLLPSLEFNGYVQRQKFSTFGLVPPPFNGKTFNIGDAAFNFNYEFDFWGKNREIVAAKVSEEYVAQAELTEAQLIISTAVAHVYFQLLNATEQTEFAKENLNVSQRLAKIVLIRAKNGIVSDLPLETALANVQQIKLAVDQYKQEEMLAKNQLAVLMGDNPFTTDIKTMKYRYYSANIILPSPLTANLIAQRPDIAAALARVQAATHRVNVQKARFFPDINLTALFSYQSVGLGHLFDVRSQNNAISGAVDLPIFDAGARRAELGTKYAEFDVSVNEYNKTILNALQETADQLATLKSLNSQLSAQMSAVTSTNRNYKLLNSRYNHGIVDYVQVLELQQLLLKQRAMLVNIQTHHTQTTVALVKALGGV